MIYVCIPYSVTFIRYFNILYFHCAFIYQYCVFDKDTKVDNEFNMFTVKEIIAHMTLKVDVANYFIIGISLFSY